MKALLNWVDHCSQGRYLALLIVLSIAGYPLFAMLEQDMRALTGSAGIPDMAIFYNAEQLEQALTSYGSAAKALYTRFQLYDLIYPAIYALALAGLTALVWRNIGPRWFALVPLAIAPVDYAENLALFFAVRSAPDVPLGLLQIAPVLSGLKYGLFGPSLLLLFFGIVLRIFRR